MRRALLLGLLLAGCSTRAPPEESKHPAAEPRRVPSPERRSGASHSATGFVLFGGNVFGAGKRNLSIDAGRALAVGVAKDAAERVVDVTGRFPGFIDSHVHLAYAPVPG